MLTNYHLNKVTILLLVQQGFKFRPEVSLAQFIETLFTFRGAIFDVFFIINYKLWNFTGWQMVKKNVLLKQQQSKKSTLM